MHSFLSLTLSACASEGYSSWVCLCVCVCVCVCVCLSGENKLLCSLTPVINSAYSIYMTNARFKTCGSKNLLALKLRSVVLHVTCTRVCIIVLVTTPNAFFRRWASRASTHASVACAWIILRGCICAYVLAIDLGFVTMPRVLHVCA